ncbi:MAG: LysR family transcriptional regulator, partial [Roseiflexaceae bacterium]|nr:LysR family transcriptional regulator [Roseiflexaceae bacterium]
RAAAGLAGRTLRLGIGPTLATYLLPDLLRRYRAQHPHYQVHISVGNTGELLDLVAADTVDLVLVGSPAEHPKLAITPFRHDHLVVIVAPQHEWASREEVSVDEVRARPLFTREPGSALHASVERVLGAAALEAETCTQLAETEAIKRCVEAGLGVALIQGIAIGREVAAGALHALALRGADDRRTYAFGTRRGRELSEAGQALVALLR